MPRQVLQVQWFSVLDHHTQHAVTGGQGADQLPGSVVDAHMHELGQHPVLAEHPQRTIAGVDQINGRLHDMAQRRLQLQPGRTASTASNNPSIRSRVPTIYSIRSCTSTSNARSRRCDSVSATLGLPRSSPEPALGGTSGFVTDALGHELILGDIGGPPLDSPQWHWAIDQGRSALWPHRRAAEGGSRGTGTRHIDGDTTTKEGAV